MTPNDKPKLAEVIGALSATFGKPVDKAALLGYWLGLMDMDIADVQRGAAIAIRQCKFMPTVREIRDCSSSQSGESVDDRAVLAFTIVDQSVTKVGSYRSADFDDPLINASIRSLGGWPRICALREEEFSTHFRREFIQQYIAFSRTGVSDELGAALPGITDKDNGLLGYQTTNGVEITTGLPAPKRKRRAVVYERPEGLPKVALKRATD